MRGSRSLFLLSVASLSLGACAIQSWAPGPGVDPTQLSRDSARCRLFARGTRPGMAFEASGSARNVAIASGAALVVGGVATAVHDAETYDDCMQAVGWIPAENVKQAAAVQAVPIPVAATPLPAPAPVAQATSARVAQPTLRPAMSTPLSAAYASVPPSSAAPQPLATTMPPLPDERTEAQARAEQAAQAWLSAQRVLNEGSDTQRRSLYGALCGAGDQSACVVAMALNR